LAVNSGSTLIVSSGGTVSATLVTNNGVMTVAFGTADGSTVNSGGQILVSGGSVSATQIGNQGEQVVDSGVVSATSVGNNGIEAVSGGSVFGTTVLSGGQQFVVGGTVSGTHLASGAQQLVSGGTVSGTVVSGGASQEIVSGATASGTAVLSGGLELVSSGTTATGTQVASGGLLLVLTGGSATGTSGLGSVVSANQVVEQTVSGPQLLGSADSGLTVISGDALYVLSGASASGMVLHGGFELLDGGADSGAVVDSGGLQSIAFGSVLATTVGGSGTQIVSGGSVFGTEVTSGGEQFIASGTVSGTQVFSGGNLVDSGGTLMDSVISAGGLESIVGSGTASGTQTIAGGELVVSSGAVVVGAVSFVSGGTLALAHPSSFAAMVSGLGAGDTIDLTSLAFSTSASSASVSGTVLSVTEGAVTQSITLSAAGFDASKVTLQDDSNDGTELIVPCFAGGTRIATVRGDVPVEALAVGDVVRLAGGGTAPVIWLGHRIVKPGSHPRPDEVQPVRVAAHAFGAGCPTRDVLLSPDHAVFCDGVLIPIRYLLNGSTIRQQRIAAVTYWHVELPAHAVLLAEGLPCESFLDTGNRAAFANGGAVVQVFPQFARDPSAAGAAAPSVTPWSTDDAVRRRLPAAALATGWRTGESAAGAVRWAAPDRRQAARRGGR
jgi:autotransporter passenger strand-loop-strand repeat protein